MAHAFVDAVSRAGADAIKFQAHFADSESTLDEAFRVAFSRQDLTRMDYWRRMEFTEEQWEGLKKHAKDVGLVFLCSVFSFAAIEMMERLGITAWKVASGEVSSPRMVERLCATGIPLLISSGMSGFSDVAKAVEIVSSYTLPFALFQCTTCYPTPLEQVGLNVLGEMRERFGCPVGLSDHSGTIWPAVAALAQGADLIEVHVTMSKYAFGPDVSSSLTFDQLGELVVARNSIATMMDNPLDKDEVAREFVEQRRLFGKSWAPARSLEPGTVLKAEDLILKKPGTGFPEDALPGLLGRVLARGVSPLRLLKESDLAPR